MAGVFTLRPFAPIWLKSRAFYMLKLHVSGLLLYWDEDLNGDSHSIPPAWFLINPLVCCQHGGLFFWQSVAWHRPTCPAAERLLSCWSHNDAVLWHSAKESAAEIFLLKKWILKLFLRLIALSDSPKAGWWQKRWSCRMRQRGRLVRSQIPSWPKPDTFITGKSPLMRYKSNQNKRIVTNVKPQRPFSQSYIMEQFIRLLQTG